MKRLLLIIMAAVALFGCKKGADGLTLLVGTYTDTDSKGIYSFRFNPETGDTTPLSVTETADPSFLAVTPDNKTVYSVSEGRGEASVSAFGFNQAKGTLTFKGSQPTKGKDPCHVTFIGKEIVATNYSSGSMTVFPLDKDGNLEEGKLVEFFESGPDSVRQAGSHIHSSQLSPDWKFLYVIDLGGDCIYRFPVSNGRITSYEPVMIKVPAGDGPRHFDFSKDGKFMYVITELGGTVLVYKLNGGDLDLVQEIEADPMHAAGSADIHFSPDGKFLYASNRLKGDGIAIFSQDAGSGLLTYVGYRETAVHPRNFTISPDGRFVLVACRDGNVIQVFNRDAETGLLKDTGKDIKIPHPVFVELVTPLPESLAKAKKVVLEPLPMQYGDTSLSEEYPFAKDPTVIHHGDRYLMYYSLTEFDPAPDNTKPPKFDAWHSAIASSKDLVNWTRVCDLDLRDSKGNPLRGAVAPCVRKLDGKIHIFYQMAWEGTDGVSNIWHATSEDGITFTNTCDRPIIVPETSWSIKRSIDAEVYRVKDKLILLFATRDKTATYQIMGMAEAPYGSDYGPDKWTLLSVDGPLMVPEYPWEMSCTEAPTVVKHDGVWYMFYAGAYNHEGQQIGLATSLDGYNYTRIAPNGLLFTPGEEGTWNHGESGHPGVFQDDDGQVYLFFQGKASLTSTYYLSVCKVHFE